MYRLLRPLLFRLEPEKAHALTLRALQACGATPPFGRLLQSVYPPALMKPVDVFGLTFPNRVGLAAGFDKDALAMRGLARIGFGHIEVGTVTPQPQPGNDRPRVFRLAEDHAVINRLGFPSRGAQYVADRLLRHKPRNIVIGVNLGKQKRTKHEYAANDYVTLIRRFASLSHYLTINISSPNTPGLRELQTPEFLKPMLQRLVTERDQQASALGRRIPMLVKIAPDFGDDDLAATLDVIGEARIDGIIVANTTISRPPLKSRHRSETGGLSGEPLFDKSVAMVTRVHEHTSGKLPIIAVGGISSGDHARRMIDAGASLVQIYSALVFRGPRLVRELVQATS